MIVWEGLDDFQDAIAKAPNVAVKAAARGLYEAAESVLTKSKRVTPVDLGTLRNSGFVDKPVTQGDTVSVELGYGGAASAYALAVHEHPSEHSPPSWSEGVQFNVGGPKYLEGPVLGSKKQISDHVSDRISDALVKEFK